MASRLAIDFRKRESARKLTARAKGRARSTEDARGASVDAIIDDFHAFDATINVDNLDAVYVRATDEAGQYAHSIGADGVVIDNLTIVQGVYWASYCWTDGTTCWKQERPPHDGPNDHELFLFWSNRKDQTG